MLRRLPRHVGAGRAARSRPAPAATLTTAPGPTSPGAGGLDPYEYTSGHWLRDDAAQRRARRVDFSFDALCQAAVRSCPGAKGIVRCDKVEGNFNRAFILGLDNGASVVARVPFSVAGPARLVTNSEVATLAYIRGKTTVPVPKVLDWSDDPANPAGTEYIIMEHAPGVQLSAAWPQMTSYQHVTCVQNLALLVKQMHALEFPAYGSIYFADAPVGDARRVELANGFCVGPHCDDRYWPCLPGEPRFYDRMPPNRGPWPDFEAFVRGLVDAGIARVPPQNPAPRLPYRGTVEEHTALLAHGRRVLEVLARDQRIRDISPPSLFHPDLHKRNIFVDPADPTVITSLIDWQSASLDPAFFTAGLTPDLCDYPESSEDIVNDPGTQKAEGSPEKTRLDKDVELCAQTWEVALMGWAPRLHKSRALDRGLLRPLRYCYSSWRDSSAAFRDGLVALSARWEELGLPGACPYQPSPEELAEHARHMVDLEDAEKLKDFLVRALNCNGDGWVPPEAFDAARDVRDAAFKQWLEAADEEMGESKARQLWPFDQ